MKRSFIAKFFSTIILFSLVLQVASCVKKDSNEQINNPPLKATFSQYIKNLRKPVLVDFGSTSCVPCKMMVPILEELKVKYSQDLETIFIHVNEDPVKVKEFKINTIPTQVFFDAKGNEISRHIGFISTADILSTFADNKILIKK